MMPILTNKLVVILSVVVTLIATNNPELQCLNNATIDQKTKLCICANGFIGNACQIQANHLTNQPALISLSQNFTFSYYLPLKRNVYRFVLSFCIPENNSKAFKVQLFVDEQTLDGTFSKQPLDQKKILNFTLSQNQKCIDLGSAILESIQKKLNGQVPKIIFGLRLPEGSDPSTQLVQVTCSIESMFTRNFLLNILIALFVLVVVDMCQSAIFALKRRINQRANAQRQQRKFIEAIANIMPSKKYSTFIQERGQQIQGADNCSICLCQFLKDQKIRQTPCRHIFHEQCLDSWCKSHLNCPICRSDFEQTNTNNNRPALNQNQVQQIPNVQQMKQTAFDRIQQINLQNQTGYDQQFKDTSNMRERML